jgi:hypothetical protein
MHDAPAADRQRPERPFGRHPNADRPASRRAARGRRLVTAADEAETAGRAVEAVREAVAEARAIETWAPSDRAPLALLASARAAVRLSEALAALTACAVELAHHAAGFAPSTEQPDQEDAS